VDGSDGVPLNLSLYRRGQVGAKPDRVVLGVRWTRRADGMPAYSRNGVVKPLCIKKCIILCGSYREPYMQILFSRGAVFSILGDGWSRRWARVKTFSFYM